VEEKPKDVIVNQPDQSPVIDISIPSLGNVPTVQHKNNTQILVIVIVLALVFSGLVGFAIWYEMNKNVTNLQAENKVLADSVATLKKASDAALEESLVANSDGIITSKVAMYKISDIQNAIWKSDKKTDPGYSDSLINYIAVSATRTSVVADMGTFRDNYKDKEWVAVQINATDTRTAGQNRAIIITDNIRLVDGTTKIAPISDVNYIAPLEEKTIYAFFPVDKTSNLFELWTGDLAKPTVTSLNFNEGTRFTGFFLMDTGFSTTLE